MSNRSLPRIARVNIALTKGGSTTRHSLLKPRASRADRGQGHMICYIGNGSVDPSAADE